MQAWFLYLFLRILPVAVTLTMTLPANAQGYPAKPIRVIVASPSGSGLDIVSRIGIEKMAQNMGTLFIPDNITGAGSNVGATVAARATPDGYTLLAATDALPLSALIYAKLNYDPLRDIQMFGTIAKAVFILSVPPSLPAQTVEEFVQLARAKPGSIAYGSSGIGTPHHIVMELFAEANGLQLLHVPYKGSAETVTGLLSATIQAAMGLPSSFAPHVKSGKFRALAVTSAKRVPAFPEIPSLMERAVASVEYESWWGLFAPTGTPRPIVNRLHAEVNKVVRDKAYVDDRLAKIGLEPFESASPEAAATLVRAYYDKLV